jgi:hypothetical protein
MKKTGNKHIVANVARAIVLDDIVPMKNIGENRDTCVTGTMEVPQTP